MSLLTITGKDLRLVARDRPALLFIVAVPVVVITIIASALASTDSGSLLLPVVNEDEGPVAEALLVSLRERVDVLEVDRAEAERLVGSEKRAGAALVLPGGLSKRYLGSRESTLTLLTDPAKGIEIETVKALLLLADRDAEQIADPFALELLVFEEQSLTSERTSIPPFEQHVPGFSLMFVLMGVLFGVAFGLRDELEWGTVTRLRVAPVPIGSLLGGKLLARFVLGVGQLLVLFVFGHLVFDISLGRSPLAFLLMVMAIVFSMVGFSLLVASFARSRVTVPHSISSRSPKATPKSTPMSTNMRLKPGTCCSKGGMLVRSLVRLCSSKTSSSRAKGSASCSASRSATSSSAFTVSISMPFAGSVRSVSVDSRLPR